MKREYIVQINFDGDPPENEEIVRCKDCKHFEPDGVYTMCYKHNGLSQNADWFCADGERESSVKEFTTCQSP